MDYERDIPSVSIFRERTATSRVVYDYFDSVYFRQALSKDLDEFYARFNTRQGDRFSAFVAEWTASQMSLIHLTIYGTISGPNSHKERGKEGYNLAGYVPPSISFARWRTFFNAIYQTVLEKIDTFPQETLYFLYIFYFTTPKRKAPIPLDVKNADIISSHCQSHKQDAVFLGHLLKADAVHIGVKRHPDSWGRVEQVESDPKMKKELNRRILELQDKVEETLPSVEVDAKLHSLIANYNATKHRLVDDDVIAIAADKTRERIETL